MSLGQTVPELGKIMCHCRRTKLASGAFEMVTRLSWLCSERRANDGQVYYVRQQVMPATTMGKAMHTTCICHSSAPTLQGLLAVLHACPGVRLWSIVRLIFWGVDAPVPGKQRS